MYYSNSDIAKPTVDSWYKTNITDKGYDSYVVTGTFCEQAKVKQFSSDTSGSATMIVYSSYTPDFKCSTDGNGYGIINNKVGLVSYEEVLYAGGYYRIINRSYYLYNGKKGTWTMSPGGFQSSNIARTWDITNDAYTNSTPVSNVYSFGLRPVINLNANVTATGTGTSSDPYVIQTN